MKMEVQQMRINMAGWNWKHPDNMEIIRPNGIHGMQIILVRSKARIQMGEKIYSIGKNNIFVVESCFPHSLFADGEEYADETKGWALVRVNGSCCSPQTIVTRCTLYQHYTTEEALQTTAKCYGGLTGGDIFLKP